MGIAFIIQILTLALHEAPLAISTVTSIKNLLSRDPAVPPDLQKILAETATEQTATMARIEAWLAANPSPTPPTPPIT